MWSSELISVPRPGRVLHHRDRERHGWRRYQRHSEIESRLWLGNDEQQLSAVSPRDYPGKDLSIHQNDTINLKHFFLMLLSPTTTSDQAHVFIGKRGGSLTWRRRHICSYGWRIHHCPGRWWPCTHLPRSSYFGTLHWWTRLWVLAELHDHWPRLRTLVR